ncbi:hypothetical protein J3Q64DRAFT_1707292 [Phycomyces blakesleeanus]|uniref:Uncharacterized protein n=1 Tax=Phycomyces blakesleeanus TaxID=4837 RepID=A0ABR3BBX4_PHYBL
MKFLCLFVCINLIILKEFCTLTLLTLLSLYISTFLPLYLSTYPLHLFPLFSVFTIILSLYDLY